MSENTPYQIFAVNGPWCVAVCLV